MFVRINQGIVQIRYKEMHKSSLKKSRAHKCAGQVCFALQSARSCDILLLRLWRAQLAYEIDRIHSQCHEDDRNPALQAKPLLAEELANHATTRDQTYLNNPARK